MDISQIVDCPIIIYDVDSPLEYAGLESIKNNVSRYLLLLTDFRYPNCYGCTKSREKQIRYIPFFSEIRSNPDQQPFRNIVFLGTNWLWKDTIFLSLCRS